MNALETIPAVGSTKQVFVMMNLLTRAARPKLRTDCTYPLTKELS